MTHSPDYVNDTIVAVATPPGKGGIGVVRVSGPLAETIAGKITGGLPEPRYATATRFLDEQGRAIDSGIALWFPAPHSFTGESVLELQGHGGPIVMSLIVDAVVRLGARRAGPGEFSQRAYLNGKLDLVQAEAVADLIDSGTAQAARAAHRSLTGAFSEAVDTLVENLVRLRLHVEATIDFPEEEIDFLSDKALLGQVENCGAALDRLERQTAAGRLLRDGLQVVIVGKPNAGKSSLLNRLSGHETAIVTEVAGTTRDILRERIDIDGLAVELIDTAGLRGDPDLVEAEGIKRAKKALVDADVVLWIHDLSEYEYDDDARPPESIPSGVPVVTLRNKADLTGAVAGVTVGTRPALNISAKTGAGIDDLRNVLREIAGYTDQGEGAFTARQRHVDALRAADRHFSLGKRALEQERAGEIFAEELRLALGALGRITGKLSSDELLGRIFSEFCIGK